MKRHGIVGKLNLMKRIGSQRVNSEQAYKKFGGFSLIEVVISLGIIAIIGVFSSTILTRTYNTTSQTDQSSKLKQNGQYALNVLVESIRMADAVVCTGTSGPSDSRKNYIVIRNNLGKYTRFAFIEPVVVSGSVTQNGYLTRQDNLDPSLVADFCSVTLFGTGTPITNSDTATGISVSGGSFNRIPGNEGKDTVNILFNLSPSLKLYNSLTDQTFQTTVKVR